MRGRRRCCSCYCRACSPSWRLLHGKPAKPLWVTEIFPDSADALGQRCVVLMRLQRLEEAQADCARAFELERHVVDHSISLGMLGALRGKTELAERYFRRALEIDPGSMVTRYQYGVLLRDLGRPDAAGQQLHAACAAQMQAACVALAEMAGRK